MMRKRSRKHSNLPKWLQRLQEQVEPLEGKRTPMPPWQQGLWTYLLRAGAGRLVLWGMLRFPTGDPAIITNPQAGVSCSLRQPTTSSQGTHGLHLYLTVQDPASEIYTLLLTPGTFARLHDGGMGKRATIPAHSLNETIVVLESGGFRAEFVILKSAYGQELPEADLLQALELEVVVRKIPLIEKNKT